MDFITNSINKAKVVYLTSCISLFFLTKSAMAQSNRSLNDSVESVTSLGRLLIDGAIVFAALLGIVLTIGGALKVFGIQEMRPGESRGKYGLAMLGGGVLVGVSGFTDLSRNTVLAGALG